MRAVDVREKEGEGLCSRGPVNRVWVDQGPDAYASGRDRVRRDFQENEGLGGSRRMPWE